MKKLLCKELLFALSIFCCFFIAFSSCSDSEDESIILQLTLDSSQQSKTLFWDETEASVKFSATGPWTATVEDVTSRATDSSCTWIKLPRYEGEAGEISLPMLLQKNDSENYREATLVIVCGESEVTVHIRQEANPNAVLTLNSADIKDFDKYYKPIEFSNMNMLRSDARWSWWRMKQSEHFFVFWEPGFGNDPGAESVPEVLRETLMIYWQRPNNSTGQISKP